MPDSTVSPQQKRTERGRSTFLDRFATPEERTEYFRALGKRSAEGRIMLSRDEAAALATAYRLLGTIAARARVAKGGGQ